MKSTFTGNTFAKYLGADLTDHLAKAPRPIDVCGLLPESHDRLSASFWEWQWSPISSRSLNVEPLMPEINAAISCMFDGPQGLAEKGRSLRSCERMSSACGKTPDSLPPLSKPFSGYIRSSINLFTAFSLSGVSISPQGFVNGISEVYPGDVWRRLVQGLPKKSTPEGRKARKEVLESFGVVNLPDLPTHDQNDACICALLAAAADNKVSDMKVKGIGDQLIIDASGKLREGPMVVPVISESKLQELSKSIAGFLAPMQDKTTATRTSLARPKARAKQTLSEDSLSKATTLCNRLIENAQKGNPLICTYTWAYRYIFGTDYTKWSQAYAAKVIFVAESTPAQVLPGLGMVRLDAFIVAKSNKLPSNGHWESANYDPEDWYRIFGLASLLHNETDRIPLPS